MRGDGLKTGSGAVDGNHSQVTSSWLRVMHTLDARGFAALNDGKNCDSHGIAIVTLTCSPFVYAIQTNSLSFLGEAHECKEDVELVSTYSNVTISWRCNYAHDLGLLLGADSRRREYASQPSHANLVASAAMLFHDAVEQLDVFVGDVGSW